DLNIGALLVMENDRLIGIISERDYRNKVILKGRASKTTLVKEIMVDEVVCVQANDKVRLCMQLMSDNKFRHLPVLDNDKVVGVMSIGDVVKSIIDKQKVEISSLRKYIATGGAYPN
ncbi:MAG: CBS domain-containing protein, partial [Balneolaceae bacterium]